MRRCRSRSPVSGKSRSPSAGRTQRRGSRKCAGRRGTRCGRIPMSWRSQDDIWRPALMAARLAMGLDMPRPRNQPSAIGLRPSLPMAGMSRGTPGPWRPVRGQEVTSQSQGYGVMLIAVAKAGSHPGLVLPASANPVVASLSSSIGLGHRMATVLRCRRGGRPMRQRAGWACGSGGRRSR